MVGLFDREDYLVLEQIDLLQDNTNDYSIPTSITFGSHAEGIIEISSSIELRIAGALELLVNSKNTGGLGGRLKALERLYRDVYSVEKGFRLNAARVLVEIMKELLECKKEHRRRLELIRDFRETYTGKPSIVRKQLKIYQLLEIPEDGSQLSFDDTVYNASKTGRKSPSLLILDAWIKGIKKLQVIFNNYIKPEVANELLASASIFGIEVEIGIELPVLYNDKFIKLVWTPLGVSSPSAFLQMLASSSVLKVLRGGEKVEQYHRSLILELLKRFRSEMQDKIESEYEVEFSSLKTKEYQNFLDGCEANEVNLSEFIYSSIISKKHLELAGEEQELIPEIILLRYLKSLSLSIPLDIDVAQVEGSISSDIKALVKLIDNTNVVYRLTLLTSNLHSWEIPEIIYKSKGGVGAVEIFNLRDYTIASEGVIKYGDSRINEFRKAINERNISGIKSILKKEMDEVSSLRIEQQAEVLEGLQKVGRNIGKLLDRYSAKHIEAAIGSGSAGRGTVFYGMGLVVSQSLHSASIKELLRASSREHLALPLGCQVYKRVEYLCGGSGVKNYWQRLVAWHKRKTVWVRQKTEEVTDDDLEGNIFTLSGRFGEERVSDRAGWFGYRWNYLNTDVKSIIKILIGFIPAFLTFYLANDWPVLKYGGGVIWFAITGGRNVLQAILSAGGFDRSLNLKWRTFVDKKRVAESLMYTGLSVPLLEYCVKDLLLSSYLGVDAGRDPVSVYALMSGINGIYIATHNYVRGFARVAIVGNLFRSALAVPIAVGMSSVLSDSLMLVGVLGVAEIVTQWSAVISKTASDTVACIIEGLADRAVFINLRGRSIRELESKFFYLCERIELLEPKKSVLDVLGNPREFEKLCIKKQSTVSDEVVLLLLDLMSFWYNKSRAKGAIRKSIRKIQVEELVLFETALSILEDEELVEGTINRLNKLKNSGKIEEFYKNKYKSFIDRFRTMLIEEGGKV